MALTHLNPTSMFTNPAFSQGVRIPAGSELVVVGGQNGIDETGAVVSDDLGEQSRQALRNVLTVLAEVGADQTHVAKLTIQLPTGADATAAYEATAEVWGRYPTAVTVLQVAGFARPDVLVEIDALAVVPESAD